MVDSTQKCSAKRSQGRFEGYRVNCESVPCLPARIVTECLSDPRRVPYLLLWRHRISGELKEAVRLAPFCHPVNDSRGARYVELKRWNGISVGIRLGIGGRGSLLICNSCQRPRCALYGWETNDGPRNVSPAPLRLLLANRQQLSSHGGCFGDSGQLLQFLRTTA